MSYSGGNSNSNGHNGPIDVRCWDCGWVGSYASSILAPTKCSQMVPSMDRMKHPDGFERCGGMVVKMDTGGQRIDHWGS